MSFYDRFVQECERLGVKPSRAAMDCGINRSNVTSWKNNGYVPRGDALQKIADYLGCSVDYLMGRECEHQSTQVAESASTARLLDAFENLNEEGQEKVITYAEDLTAIYKNNDSSGVVSKQA